MAYATEEGLTKEVGDVVNFKVKVKNTGNAETGYIVVVKWSLHGEAEWETACMEDIWLGPDQYEHLEMGCLEVTEDMAGNYVFIADAMIDQWEASNGMTMDNGEVIITCHELGHSIGILQLKGQPEKYDPDRYSIMSTMNIENALCMEGNWYYSGSYWDTKNLGYYVIP